MAAVPFLVEFAVANALKFTRNGVDTSQRANFDQRRVADSKSATIRRNQDFSLPFENGDPLKIQFFTNYTYRRVRIIDCDGLQYDPTTGFQNAFYYTPDLVQTYINLKYRADCKFSSINNKLFIYFETGNEYSDEDFLTITGQIALEGRLPNINAAVGDLLRFKIADGDFTSALIESIAWSPTLQAQGFLTDIDTTLLTPADGLVEVTYDEREANLYEQEIDLSNLNEGNYRIVVELGLNSVLRVYTSEKIFVKEIHEDSLAIDYAHLGTYNEFDLWNYLYQDGWKNRIRLPIDFYKVVPAGEVEADVNDSGIQRLLRAVPFRQITLTAYHIPDWVIDKLGIVFSHDTKIINEYEWEIENLGSVEDIAMANVGTFSINLRQKNDRTKRSDSFTEELTAFFTPSSFTAIAFVGDTLQAIFNTSSGGTFEWASLPSWITPDKLTFVDGDLITFTIDANSTFFTREITLIAICEQFDGLTASISFEQEFDETEPEFIDADNNSVAVPKTGGNALVVNISSSGPWEAINQSGFSFTIVTGASTVTISKATANNTEAPITGVVRVRLTGNPSIFEDINVIQPTNEDIFNVVPNSTTVGPLDQTIVVELACSAAVTWQASSPQEDIIPDLNHWLHFDTSPQIGPTVSFSIVIDGKPPYITEDRIAVVTFFNIANPSDNVTLTITQTS